MSESKEDLPSFQFNAEIDLKFSVPVKGESTELEQLTRFDNELRARWKVGFDFTVTRT